LKLDHSTVFKAHIQCRAIYQGCFFTSWICIKEARTHVSMNDLGIYVFISTKNGQMDTP